MASKSVRGGANAHLIQALSDALVGGLSEAERARAEALLQRKGGAPHGTAAAQSAPVASVMPPSISMSPS